METASGLCHHRMRVRVDLIVSCVCRILTGHWAPMHTVCVSPCGRWLASAGDDRAVLLWDIGLGRRFCYFKGHTKAIHSLHFSPCGRWLASASADSTVKIWDVSALKEAARKSGTMLYNSLLWSILLLNRCIGDWQQGMLRT